MHINVLRKRISVNNYLYYGIVLLLVGFQSVYSAQGERPTQQNSPATQGESKPEPSPVISPTVSQPGIQEPQPSVHAEKSPEQQKTSFWDTKFTDWLQVGINAVLLIVVFWQARINRDQRMTMSKQNEIMQTQNMIMHHQQEIMQGELDVTRDAIKQGDRALLASEAQAQAAKDSVLIAQEAFYVGEGPYFGFTGMGLSISSNRPNVKFTVTNGGRTPAWSFDPQVWILLGDTPQTADQRWHMGESNLVYAHRFFAVGQRYDFTFWDKEAHISQETREAIKRGETRLFVAGTLHYKDMRGHKRSQNFTAIWDAPNGSMKDWEV